MAFYKDAATNELPLQQGDILHPVPFVVVLASSAQVLEDDEPERGRVSPRDLTGGGAPSGDVVVPYEIGTGLVITQTCDIERGDRPVIVARVRPYEGSAIGSRKFFENLNNVKNPGKAPTVFWLPRRRTGDFDMEYSIVSLLELQTFSSADLNSLKKVRRLSISETALGALQERIAFCFGRWAIPEDLYVSDDIKDVWEEQKKK